MGKEWLARTCVIFGLVLAISIPVVGWWSQSQGIVVHAHMAEDGGWTPGNLVIGVGEPLHLRLTSDDVTHGFAIGQSDQPAVDIKPGVMTEVTMVFDKPGKYTFYCTRWCSVNHWRMRGTIEVTGTGDEVQATKPPLYVTLGLNIDADHHSSITLDNLPSALRGALFSQRIPEEYKDHQYYLTHTPIDLWLALKSSTAFNDLTDQDVWDMVAWVWQSNTTPIEIKTGKELYGKNCAVCHGETGAGNGVFANQPAENGAAISTDQAKEMQTQPPANFTDPGQLLSASPAHLQGKIIRGGMGTGMPYWGPIFTEDQTWALVAYLWTFQFQWR